MNKPEVLKSMGPLLLAANHPNSFLDGMILTTLFDQPLYSLARGDAFKYKWLDRLLRSLRLFPIYRTSEGAGNLEHNYTTFDACRKTFEKKGNVLIFSEGLCENEWHLRPLKKGTARLAITSWKHHLPLQVIPTAFNYSSFKKFGKEVHLFFGTPIDASLILQQVTEGKQMLAFNNELQLQLKQMVYEIAPHDKQQVKKIFSMGVQPSFYFLLLPAFIGFILHAPFYFACKLFTDSKFKQSGHYDAVMTALLVLLYPCWWLIVFLIVFFYLPTYALLVMLAMPFTARACVAVKYQAGL